MDITPVDIGKFPFHVIYPFPHLLWTLQRSDLENETIPNPTGTPVSEYLSINSFLKCIFKREITPGVITANNSVISQL